MSLFGGIEAGGTKFICAVGSDPNTLQAQARIPTTTPSETLSQVVHFFRQQQAPDHPIKSIGIGSFGPVGVNPKSSKFGWFLNTPKPGWKQIDFVGFIQRELGIDSIGFDTDVNAAALGEHRWGNAQGLDNFIYLTVGTGVGGGGMIGGQLIHGLLHPEMGHILLPQDKTADPFEGVCPFHKNCLEGLASGLAIEKRWGQKADTLPPDHPAWALEAKYLALGLVNYSLTLSPERIILGGGVMAQKQLYPLVRQQVQTLLNGYLDAEAITQNIDSYIVPPKLGDKAGFSGAFALAEQALNSRKQQKAAMQK